MESVSDCVERPSNPIASRLYDVSVRYDLSLTDSRKHLLEVIDNIERRGGIPRIFSVEPFYLRDGKTLTKIDGTPNPIEAVVWAKHPRRFEWDSTSTDDRSFYNWIVLQLVYSSGIDKCNQDEIAKRLKKMYDAEQDGSKVSDEEKEEFMQRFLHRPTHFEFNQLDKSKLEAELFR